MITFELDGTIVSANENFCRTLGYEEHEIVGRHHRMFVDPVFAASPEYISFWDRLNRAGFVAGEVKRIGEGGREVWIQASYNPVLNASGLPY